MARGSISRMLRCKVSVVRISGVAVNINCCETALHPRSPRRQFGPMSRRSMGPCSMSPLAPLSEKSLPMEARDSVQSQRSSLVLKQRSLLDRACSCNTHARWFKGFSSRSKSREISKPRAKVWRLESSLPGGCGGMKVFQCFLPLEKIVVSIWSRICADRNLSTLINCCHLGRLYVPIIGIVLDYAQRVNPKRSNA